MNLSVQSLVFSDPTVDVGIHFLNYVEYCILSSSSMYMKWCYLSSVSCSAQKSAWLESLQQQLEQQEVYISGDMRRLLLMMLSSVYLLQDTVTQLSTLEALRKFVKRFPNLVRTYRCFIADVD